MEITDIMGKTFTINDIKGTVALVEAFLDYRPTDMLSSLQRLDEHRLKYWNDFHAKLLRLQEAADGCM